MPKKTSTRPYDAAAYLKTERDCALYLQAAIDEAQGDAAIVVTALGDIARARGMMALAKETGITREGLYKALSPEGNPSFATVIKVCDALGLKLHAAPARTEQASVSRRAKRPRRSMKISRDARR